MKKKVVVLFCILTVFVSVFASGNASGLFDWLSGNQDETVIISKEEYERLQKFAKLDEMMQYVEAYYYEAPDEDAMLEMAARGLLAGLGDPYTFYYSAEDWAQMIEDDEGEYGGIGVQMLGNYEQNTVTITRVFKNTPAEKSGLLRGDILVRVDDIEVDASSMQTAVSFIRGSLDTPVEIEVIRNGESLVFSVERAIIHVNRVEYTMLEDQVGLICLYEFAGDCAEAFKAALDDLIESGAKSIVLDLRDNGGGNVSDCIAIADLFLDRGVLFYAQDREENRENYYTTDGAVDLPLIVLVNEYSASASEILSGSLQDRGRATLMGTLTYGKGIMQWVFQLEDADDGMQLTFAQYFLPSGTKVHKIGITPDIIVEMPEDAQNAYLQFGDLSDPQLAAAWEEARKQAQ